MFNHSLSQLRQISLANIQLPLQRTTRSTSGSSVTFSPNVSYSPRTKRSNLEDGSRPPALRRRSTRGKPAQEAPLSRFQRLEAALIQHALESFFVVSDHASRLYISEVLPGTNPCFEPFALQSRSRSIEVTVFVRQQGRSWRRLLQHTMPLGDLIPLDPTEATPVTNAVLLQFEEETWYLLAPSLDLRESRYVAPKAESYSVNQVLRLQTLTEFINDALQSIASLKKKLSNLLREAEDRLDRARELCRLKLELQDVRDDLSTLTKKNRAESKRVDGLRDDLALRRSILDSSRKHMVSVKSDLRESHDALAQRRPAASLLISEIHRVRQTLVTTLAEIYPIVTTSTVSRIRGLKTAPNCEYSQQNNEESAALGYIAHLVFLLAHLLGIPLRYPLRPISSHSFILDPISIMPHHPIMTTTAMTPMMHQMESASPAMLGPPQTQPKHNKRDRRQFPLFYERGGVDRLQWAVFLLNKDIEQVLQHQGLVCGDLRDSLRNLESLVLWLISTREPEPDDGAARPNGTTLARSSSSSSDHGTDDLRLNGRGIQQRLRATESHTSSVMGSSQTLDSAMATLEIVNHKDLLAAQLQSKLRDRGGSRDP